MNKTKKLFSLLFILFSAFSLQLQAQVKGNAVQQLVAPANARSSYSQGTSNTATYYQEQSSYGIANYQEYLNVNPVSPITREDMMEFEVNCLMNVEAESYLAIFNVTQLGETAQEADNKLKDRINELKKDLGDLGIPEEDVYVDIVSLIPLYEFEVEKKLFSKNYNEVPSGFELQKNVHIRYKKPELLDQILTFTARQEIYELVKVDYFTKNPEEAYGELRKQAIASMETKIKDFEALGVSLDTTFKLVSEDQGVAYPLNRYSGYQAYYSNALSKSGRGEVNKVRKPTAYYYNKLPYDPFDIVVNPEYLEPVVQYTYRLKVRYIIKQKPVKQQTQFFWLTPTGQKVPVKVEQER